MTQQEIERLHAAGKMPDWAYYQQIDKPIWLKLEEQTNAFLTALREDDKVEQEITKTAEDAILKILGDLFKN